VDGLIEIPINPIIAAVAMSGMILGTKEMRIILSDVKSKAINIVIIIRASKRLVKRLLTRYCVPFKNTTLVPVICTSNFSGGKIESIFGFNSSLILLIS